MKRTRKPSAWREALVAAYGANGLEAVNGGERAITDTMLGHWDFGGNLWREADPLCRLNMEW